MSAMIERIADAMEASAKAPSVRAEYLHLADVAIRAMREPTVEMAVHGVNEIDWWRGSHEIGDWTAMPPDSSTIAEDVADCWRRMIDEALK